jgi:para-nitrobenzyl esterase
MSPYNPPRVPEPSIPGKDTLNVNVTTPDPRTGAKLPVLVWIHGGGFIGGCTASPWYAGGAFARDGVVVVTASYRLGFEGFGWLADAGTGGVVNNRGVLDWLAGLEWVQRNIAAFGGDPSRVTIAGQSAGGAAVMRLLTMPAAQHLFNRVLAISPADASSTVERSAEATRRIAAAVGIVPTGAAASAVDENVLFAAGDAAEDEVVEGAPRLIFGKGPLELAPAVDGSLCVASMDDALAAGVGADKDLFLGATAHEFNEALRHLAPSVEGADPVELLQGAGASAELAAAFVDQMAADGDLERGPAWVLGQALSTVIFRQAVAHWARARDNAPGKTWTYDFRWESQSPLVFGSAHCVDLPFGWDILGAEGTDDAVGSAPQALAVAVHEDWLSFIRDGEVAAPQHREGRATVVYRDQPVRSIEPRYDLEATVWEHENLA